MPFGVFWLLGIILLLFGILLFFKFSIRRVTIAMNNMENVPRLRLARAMVHINEFESEVRIFLDDEPHSMITEFYDEGGQEHFKFSFRVIKEPSKRLGIIAGECIHHLRAIMDNIIWSLASIHCATRPLGYYDKISFPICETSFTDYQTKLSSLEFKGINDFPSAARDLIENLQPYKGAYSIAPKTHPISVLSRLWNDDKHRSPAIFLGIVDLDMKGWPYLVDKGITVKDGAVFAHGIVPNPKPDQYPIGTLYIAFDTTRSPVNILSANYYLRTLHDFIRDEVITQFEPILAIGRP